ncbi:MBL fold metallo-hydrolase [Epibacterium ulvae]|uniref:MBL fold metallo-hydrolase n=1 Tax=Epibacterium ulvae TaxID=1156985 RepID=UPI0024919B81|nr:MBL fold metallo-hydrolase [Epibacterium ulvae]
MSKLITNRRSLLVGGAAAALSAPSILRANTLGGGPLGQGSKPLEHGVVTIADFGEVKIHSYQSPDLTGCVTTHVIETPERLVFVDGQRSVIYGQEVRDYAERTGKPVDRMIVSHLHPDHWFGAYQFRDVPIYSFAETQAEINQLGDFFIEISLASLGKHVPPSKVVPNQIIAHGAKEVIDGVTLEFRHVTDAESDNMMTIYLPDQKVLIAQDMLYNNCHLFCGHGNFDGWSAGLREMQADTSFDLVLPGHGPTTGSRQAIDDGLVYLDHVQTAYAVSSSGDELKAAILERYPSYMAAGLVDIQNLFLFPKS